MPDDDPYYRNLHHNSEKKNNKICCISGSKYVNFNDIPQRNTFFTTNRIISM